MVVATGGYGLSAEMLK
ncbi:Protein of unknown function [Lactobacillus delbrueckii subsp. lactis]|nr:Protein of unknown function [Lactobacillus delbrueckii subsp. lactis]